MRVPVPLDESALIMSSREPPAVCSIVASNRDEFLARPTTRAAWHAWDPSQLAQQPSDTARVLSGLDLSAGGTWLGISLPPTEHRTLRFATLTNYTETIPPAQRPSRGNLTRAFLDPPVDAPLPSQAQSVDPLQQYLDQVEATKADYAGFNLLVGQVAFPAPAASAASQPPSAVAGPVTRLGYISNRETPSKRARVLDDIGTAGHVRGLSNATLEVEEGEQEWPKVKSGAAAVERAARRAQEEVDRRGLSAEEAEERLVEGLYEALRCVCLQRSSSAPLTPAVSCSQYFAPCTDTAPRPPPPHCPRPPALL